QGNPAPGWPGLHAVAWGFMSNHGHGNRLRHPDGGGKRGVLQGGVREWPDGGFCLACRERASAQQVGNLDLHRAGRAVLF
ncbi:hypothetical protein Q2319_26365, partial [Escherichia coli]|nr:hypothetical protein [Escherichia coli]